MCEKGYFEDAENRAQRKRKRKDTNTHSATYDLKGFSQNVSPRFDNALKRGLRTSLRSEPMSSRALDGSRAFFENPFKK